MYRRKWWNWLLGMSETEVLYRQEQRMFLEKEYEKIQNKQRQLEEDMSWDRDIRYRADKMMIEWDHEMMKAKMRGLLDTFPTWTPLIIAPLSRKTMYIIYDTETAKYKDTNLIHEALMKRFREVRAMNEPIPEIIK